MIPADPPADDYAVILQALKFAAQEARQAGMPDVEDQYLDTLVRLIAGDVELNPRRRLVR